MNSKIDYTFVDRGNIISDYNYSKKTALSSLIFGILGILYGLWLGYNYLDIIIWAIVMVVLSLGSSIWGYKKWRDNNPVIIIYQMDYG